jgi:abortive infection bacteriophage resistance protein
MISIWEIGEVCEFGEASVFGEIWRNMYFWRNMQRVPTCFSTKHVMEN